MRIKLLMLLMALGSATAWAERTAEWKLDSLAEVFIADKKYQQALTALEKEGNMIQTSDSLYLPMLLKTGFCYYQLDNPMKAIQHLKLASDLFPTPQTARDSLLLASLNDNLGICYHKMNEYGTAFDYSQRAVALGSKYPRQVSPYITELCHAARIAISASKPEVAVECQRKAVELICQRDGQYADLHIDNLSLLRSYYKAVADSVRYNETAQQIRQLRQQITEGVVPDSKLDISTPRLCRAHNQEALLCCRWMLGNYLNTPGQKEAADFITQFRRRTPDVAIYLGPAEERWMHKAHSVYLVAYIAASCDYALRHPSEWRYSFEQYEYAINRLIDYYEANKNLTAEVRPFDSYLSQRRKHPEEFRKTLEEDFERYCDAMRSKKNGAFLVDRPTIMNFEY